MREPHKLVSKRALIYLNQVLDITPHILIRISTFLYYNALKRNTLDSIEAINSTNNPDKKGVLVRRFLRFKSNEAKYVQVAVSKIYSIPCCQRTRTYSTLHFYVLGCRGHRLRHLLPLLGQSSFKPLVRQRIFLFQHRVCACSHRDGRSAADGLAWRRCRP